MSIEQKVAKHYGRQGLAESILARARQEAENPDRLTTADLSAFDDMHVGGRRATAHLLDALGLAPGMRVLDIGSGIGGAARYASETYGAEITGIDLTPEYKEVAEALSAAVGLAERLAFVTGSALEMPFADNWFDAAYTIHAAMNIQDKQSLYREAHRVLKPGAVFGVYDVMAGQGTDKLQFPVPWADDQNTSFLLTPREVEALLENAGFTIFETESRRDFAMAALNKALEHERFKVQADEFKPKLRNLINNIENGRCAPWQIICRKK